MTKSTKHPRSQKCAGKRVASYGVLITRQELRLKAFELEIWGKSVSQIADEFGCPESEVKKLIEEAREQNPVETPEMRRALAVVRLETAASAISDKVLSGDLRAINLLVKLAGIEMNRKPPGNEPVLPAQPSPEEVLRDLEENILRVTGKRKNNEERSAWEREAAETMREKTP
jgi:hypothetical protein